MNPTTISANTALVYTMVIVSASDSDMTDSELKLIGSVVRTFPAFNGYDEENIIRDAENCAAILGDEEGLEAVLGLIKEAVPKANVDTAYALACDVAVADGSLAQEELRLLEMIRHTLGVDRLTAAAIERGAAARARTL